MLRCLNINYSAEALPCVTCCPLCGKSQLFIYQDTTDDGQWHHCKACKSSGDIVQLASKVWGLTIRETADHLGELLPGLRDSVPSLSDLALYESNLTRQKNVHAFLTDNMGKFVSSTAFTPLKLRLGIADLTSEHWPNRGGKFVVAATREQIENMIGIGEDKSPFRTHGNDSKTWKEVVMIPFWDLPGRISAIQLCHIQNDYPTPFHYRSLLGRKFGCGVVNHSGIALFDAIDNSDPALGEDLFVMMDPVLGLRVQVERLRRGDGGAMPLVAVHPDAHPSSYFHDHCPGRRVIFWDQQLSVGIFQHAKAANGYIADRRPGEELRRFLNRQTSTQWLNMLRQSARRWEDVLEDYLAALTSMDVAAFLFRLNWSDVELDRFIQGCAPATRQRLEELCAQRRHNRRVTINGHGIMETKRGWQLTKNDEVISEVTFRLEQVIHYEDGRHFYQGRCHFRDKSLDFTAPGKEFDKAPLTWLRKLCIHQDIGAPAYLRTWQGVAIPLAQKFHEPKTVPGLDRCGWDARRVSFMTSDYAIRSGGEVEKHGLPSPDDFFKVNLPDPSLFNQADVKFLSEKTEANEFAWAVAGCVLHDVLARVFNYETSGLLLSGAGVGNAIELSKSLGCPTRLLDTDQRVWPGIDSIRETEQRAAWPILVPNTLTNTTHPQAWLRCGQHNSIVQTEWVHAHVYMIGNRWKYLDSQHVKLDTEVIQTIRRAVPAFLQALAARRLKLWHVADIGTLRHTFVNLASWFKHEMSGNATVIDHAYDLPRFDEEGLPANMFFELIAFLFTEGRLITARGDCVPKRKQHPCLLYLSDPDAVWIPKPGINQALTGRMRHPTLDINAVSLALSEGGKLLDDRVIDGIPGWVVPRKSFDMGLKMWNRSTAKTFGVVR